MGFWDKHDKILRKGRITQAAAVIYAGYRKNDNAVDYKKSAVLVALDIERMVTAVVDAEEEKYQEPTN